MEYSKISTIELINFMSFKKAKVAFDETGIINIKGYNDSGKSAVLRGLVVCLMDMFKRNQVKFIRYGEEYFRVVVTFEDGVSILRDKYINGQSLYEVYKDGELMFTTKQGNKLAKVDGVPKVIEDYLGLCVTDSVYLNYQSCIDKLPVVDTTGSENYQMFHEVLRMEEIYRANNMINTDKNELGGRIAEIEADVQKNEILLEKCGDVSQELIDELEKLDFQAKGTNDRKEYLMGMKDIVDRYENIPDIPEIGLVPVDRLKKLEGVKGIISSLENIPDIPEIKRVSGDRLVLLKNIEEAITNIEGFVSIPDIPKVDTTLVSKRMMLNSVVKSLNDFAVQSKKCKEIDSELEGYQRELNDLVQSAKEKGIEFVKCDNCGSYTVVGGEHAHEV